MKGIIILSLLLSMAILPYAFDVYADDDLIIETEGQSFDKIENYNTGEAVWTSHVERILDGTWKNYVLENNSDKVIWNSNAVGSFIWDKNSCSYSIYEKGWTDPSKQIIPSVSSVGTYLNNGNWENLDVNDENCVTEVLNYKEFAIITSTKTITEDVITPVFKEWTGTETEFNESIALNGTSFTLQNINGTQGFYNGQTITNSGVEIEKFVQEIRLDIHNGFKETFKIWKNDGNQQLGISQTAHIPNGQIVIADEVISISEFSGQSFNRQYLEDNESEIFEITDKLHYNFDKGFPFLTNVNIIDDGNFKVNMDYSSGDFVNYLEIDPTFTSTPSGTQDGWYRDSNGDNNCATVSSESKTTANLEPHIYGGVSSNIDCQLTYIEFPISGFPATATVTDVALDFYVSSVTTPDQCDVRPITSNRPTTSGDQNVFNEIMGATDYTQLTECQSTGQKSNMSLGSQAVSNFPSAITNGWFAIGLKQDTDTVNANKITTISAAEHSSNPEPKLTITYTLPTAPNPPTNLQTTAGMPIGLDWDIPSSDGGSSITGYKVFRTSEQYSQVELPENSQNADGVDFTGNELLLRGAESVTQVPLVVNNNFASNSGFTLGQMSVSNNKLSGTVASSGSTTYLDLRSENIDHDKWNMRFGLKITGTNTGSLNPLFIGLADYASIYNSNFASGDHIGTVLYTSDAQPYNLRVVNDETAVDYTRSSSTPVTNTQYYVEIIKNEANTSVRYYDSADFTDSGSSLPLLQGSNGGSVSGFDYFIVKPYNSGSGSHTIEITDLKVYSGITDSTSSATYNIIEDKSSNDIEISNFGSAIQKHRDSYDWLSLGFKLADETLNGNNRYVDVSPSEESGTDPTLTIIADGTTYTLVATEDLVASSAQNTGCTSPNSGTVSDSSAEWFAVTAYPSSSTYNKCVRGMAEFDISSIPTTASIQSATMTWKVDGNALDSTDRIDVYVMDQQGTTLTDFTDLYQGISSGELITNAIEISGTGEKTFDISALTTPYFNTKQNGIMKNGIINPNFSFSSTDIFDNTDNFSLGSWVKITGTNTANSKLLEFNTVDFTVSNSVAKIEESEIVTTYKPFATSIGTSGNSISQNADGTYTKTGSNGWNTKAYNPTSFSSSTGSTLEVVIDGTNQMFGFRNDVPTSGTITSWDYLIYCGGTSCQHYYNSYNYGNCNGQTGYTYTYINGISIGDSVKLTMDSSGVVKSYLNDVTICTFGGQYTPNSASGNWYEYITRYGAGSSSGPMTQSLSTTTILEKTGLTNSQTDFEHHAFTRDGSTWTYYKNGQSEATATSTESLGSNSGINYNIDYQGVLDEYFIDNTALSASTIDSIYDRGVSPTQVGTTNSATTEFDDNNSLVAGTEYFYTLKSTNTVGDSIFLTPLVSATAGTPADPPTNIQASIANTATAPLDVTVTWSPPSNVGTGTLTGFQIFRDGVSVGTVGLVQTFPDTVPSSGTYAYTVKSLSTHGTSVASSADSITTPSAPSQPTLTVTALDSSSIKLDWTASNENGSTLQGYKIEYSLDNSNWNPLVSNTGNTDVTRTATSLNPDDQYYWKVSGINGVGAGTPSIVKNTWTLLAGPTNLVATAMSENQIDLAWTGISGISSYTIQFESPTGNGFTNLATSVSSSDTTYTSGSLTTGTQYNYRIVGISSNSGLASVPSNESSANTFGILPAPVLDTLTSVTVNPATVQLDWTAPTGSPSATGYKIERNLGSGFVVIETDSGSTSTTYLDQATTALNEPQYRVSAINSYGVSDPSNELTLTTTSSGGQGGGGGGGGSSSSSQQTKIIDDLLNVSLVGNTHIMTVGEFLTGKIPVSWDSGENLRISEISYDSSILGSIKFNIEESTPIILQGSGNSFSSGDITYTISTPNDLCSSTIKNNCLVEKVYELPITITSTSSGDTLTQKTVITIDTSAGFGGQTLALLSIFIMAIIAGVGIIKFARKSNGKGKRKSVKSSNGKKKARKSVN